jgi:NAD-dependent deacetylase
MSVLFVTGAGISASAGIATYRGENAGSSWTNSDLEKKSHADRYGNHLDELWDRHWGPLYETMQKSEPTVAHKAIAAFQKNHEAIIATQNIDDLHERAGSDNVAHVHGVMEVRCMKCKTKPVNTTWDGDGAPVCTNCGSKKTRPDVVLFGENLNRKQFKGLEYFAQMPATTHVIAVGTGLWVHPIAGLVMDTLGKVGKTTILVNKGDAQFSKWFTEVHDGPADELLPDVLEAVDKDLS